MGQFLSQPVTDKEAENGGDDFLKYGMSSMQGWRVSMEDSHSLILDLNKIKGYKQVKESSANTDNSEGNDEEKQQAKEQQKSSSEDDNKQTTETELEPIFDEQIAFFGVFDGHGGSRVALFSGEHLPQIVKDHHELINSKQYAKALQDSFLACDRAILDDPAMRNDSSGCAATTIMVTKDKLICANSGDSRIVLSIDGYAKPMSYDHKPTNEGEKARIVAAGGFVDVGRVNGNLALSRCIGDFDFKKSNNLPPEEQIVTAFPDIIEHQIDYAHDEFIVLACDGIWDCLTSQQCVELVRKGIHERQTLTEISESIIDVCVAPNSMGTGIGCDNMSIAVVALLNGKSLEQWYDDIIAKGEPVSKPFDEVRREIYATHLGPNDDFETSHGGNSSGAGDDGERGLDESDDAMGTIGKSLSQLINRSSATFQDGTYYIDTSNSSSFLASLGILSDERGVSGLSGPLEDRSSEEDEDEEEEVEEDDEDHENKSNEQQSKVEEIEDTNMKNGDEESKEKKQETKSIQEDAKTSSK